MRTRRNILGHEVIIKSSLGHHEESEAERWRFSALEHFVPDGQTDTQSDWAPVGTKKNE